MKVSRNINLDAMRGLAVVLVVMHHFVQYFSNGYQKFQFSLLNEISQFFLEYGQYGVEIFFIVSGYVMYSMYSDVENLGAYLVKRVTRLIPALWITISVNLLVLYMHGTIRTSDVLSSISSGFLIDPPIPNRIFDVKHFHWTDDSFWTLFVEIRFYVFFGITFYLLRKLSLETRIYLITGLIVISKILSLLLLVNNNQSLSTLSHYFFFPEWSGFFLAGIWIGRASHVDTRKGKVVIYLGTSVLCLTWALTSFHNQFQTRTTPVSAIVIMFILVNVILKIPRTIKVFIAQKLGAPSYVSYVIHQMIFREAKLFDENSLGSIGLGVIALITTFILAYQFHVKFEIKLIQKLRKIVLNSA
jgi:peptidoglycan/LPS O-acetylase OafA/YrhL